MQPDKVILETEGVVSAEVASIPGILHQELHPDGQPRRPMNAFMIFARHRRPAIQSKEPGLKTGDISKRLSYDWKNLEIADKAHYLRQAKILKDEFQARFPDYVYKRRPNNAASSRRKSTISLLIADKGAFTRPEDRTPFPASNGMLPPSMHGQDNPQSMYRPPSQNGFPPIYERRNPAAGCHGRVPPAPVHPNGAVAYPSAQSQSSSPFSPHESNASPSGASHYMRLPPTSNMQNPGSPSPYWYHPEDSYTSAPSASNGHHNKNVGMSPTLTNQPLSASSFSSGRPSYVGAWSDYQAGPTNSRLNSPMTSLPPTPVYPPRDPSPQSGCHARTQSLNGPPALGRQPSPAFALNRHRQASAPDLQTFSRTQHAYEGLYDGRRPDIPEDSQPNERDLPPLNARSYRFASQGRLVPPDVYHDYGSQQLHLNAPHSQQSPSNNNGSDDAYSMPQSHPVNLPPLTNYAASRNTGYASEHGGQPSVVGSGADMHNSVAVFHPQPHAPGRINMGAHMSANDGAAAQQAPPQPHIGSMFQYERGGWTNNTSIINA